MHSIDARKNLQYTDTRSFLLLGRISSGKVISKIFSGSLFLAWRCLYAEMVQGKIENIFPDMKKAYKRVILMTVTRLTAYGEKWLKWVRKNRGTGNKHFIPERHQNKIFIKQSGTGEYELHPLLLQEIDRLRTT